MEEKSKIINTHLNFGGHSHDLVIEEMGMSLGMCPGPTMRNYW